MAGVETECSERDSILMRDSGEFFENLFDEDGSLLFFDSTISCDGKIFEVQRNVLAAFSPVLKRLFIKNRRNNPGKPLELPKEFVTKESFALIVDLIYKGQVTIDGDNVLRLHSAGNYLEIEQVVNKCSDFVTKRLNIDSVVSVWDYACKITASANRLLKESLRFTGDNFSKLVKHDTLLALKKGEFCLLLSQLRNVDDENLVLDAVLEWLGHDWKARFKDCEGVLSCVLWQFVDHARCVQLNSVKAIESKMDQKSFEEVATMKMLLAKIGGIAEEVSLDSSGSNIYYLIDRKEGSYTLQKLSLVQQEPNRAPVVSKTEQQIQQVKGFRCKRFFTFQDRLMTVLSHEEDGCFNQGFMLAGISENGEPKMLAQLEVLEMDVSYDRVKITLHGGILSIFVSSFCFKPFMLSTYDLRKFGRRFLYDDELFIIPVLSRTVDSQGTAHLSFSSPLPFTTEVYFFGGGNDIDSYPDGVYVDVFHVATQKWSKLPCLRAGRTFPTAELIDRSFFVVGGRNGNSLSSVSNAVEMMSIDDPTAWTQLPGLNYGRVFGRLISCGYFLIVFGGKDGDSEFVKKAEILDLQNLAKGWEEFPPLHGVNERFVVKA